MVISTTVGEIIVYRCNKKLHVCRGTGYKQIEVDELPKDTFETPETMLAVQFGDSNKILNLFKPEKTLNVNYTRFNKCCTSRSWFTGRETVIINMEGMEITRRYDDDSMSMTLQIDVKTLEILCMNRGLPNHVLALSDKYCIGYDSCSNTICRINNERIYSTYSTSEFMFTPVVTAQNTMYCMFRYTPTHNGIPAIIKIKFD
jgi:hypothetical protein